MSLGFGNGVTHPSPSTVSLDAFSAAIAQLVEHQPSKLRVAGSNPVRRSLFDLLTETFKKPRRQGVSLPTQHPGIF